MAKSRSIGSIYAELSLRDGKFKGGLKSAAKKLKEFAGTSAKYAAAGAAGGVTAAAVGLAAGTRHTLDQVDALADLSNQTGFAVGDMMKLQLAYKDGGREAEMAGKDIGKMQKAIVGANSGGADPFKTIGLSAKNLLEMNPAAQFSAIGAAILRISNPAERTAKAMEIFGKGGMGLKTVFEGLPDAEKALGRMPELAQKFAGAMGDANDLLGHLPLKSDQFFMGFTAGIIGQLLPQLEKIDKIDFTTKGETFGKSLATAFQTISDGSIWELFRLHGEQAIAALQSSNVLNGLVAAINAIDAWAPGSDKSYSEAFAAYANAGVEANTEIIDDLQKKIDAINKGIAARYDAAQSDAAGRSKKPDPPNPLDHIYQAPLTPAPAAAVNDYQRRGLSLDGTKNPIMDKQTELFTQMRDYLKKMVETNMHVLLGHL